MKTGIITTDTYSSHDTGQGHPERADRVTIVNNHLRKIKNLDWKKLQIKMRKPSWVFDTRAILDSKEVKKYGINIWSIGCGE